MPLVDARSAYGSSIQAPREPSAPSIARLVARTVNRLSP